MKILRIWLVLLLAALLPVRGAVAAEMLCPVDGSGSQVELRVQTVDPSMVHHMMDEAMASMGDMDAHHHAGVEQAHTSGHHHDQDASGHGDKCKFCSSFCSMTPLLGANAVALPALELATATFPSLSAPALSFLSDGQERPPRTLTR